MGVRLPDPSSSRLAPRSPYAPATWSRACDSRDRPPPGEPVSRPAGEVLLAAGGGESAGATALAHGASGTSTTNVVPPPRVSSMRTVPAIAVTSSRTIASPRPVPPKRRVVVLSACSNFSTTAARFSAGMPIPATSANPVSGPKSTVAYRSSAASLIPSIAGSSGVTRMFGTRPRVACIRRRAPRPLREAWHSLVG